MDAAELLEAKAKAKTIFTEEALQEWMINHIAREMKVDAGDIAVDVEFSQYALDSTMVLSMTAELEDILGRKLSPTLAYNYPTIELLVAHLVRGG
jgi:acyl carrier protein